MNGRWFGTNGGLQDTAARPLRMAIVALVVLALHTAANATARHALESSAVTLLPGLHLRVVENTRGPFGLGPGVVSLIVGAAVLGALVLSHARMPILGLGLLVGGGIANLTDRVLIGKTTDILVLANITALNVADVAIVLGLALLLWPWRSARRG